MAKLDKPTIVPSALLPRLDVGLFEYYNDSFYGTIGTGPARKTFAFRDDVTYIGTTSVALNRASAPLALAGISSIGIRDTSAAFDVTIGMTSSTTLGAAKTLTIDMVNVSSTIKLGYNLSLTAAATVGGTNTGDVSLATDHGLSLTGQVLAMGTPSTCTAATTNAVSTTTHTHAITGFLTSGANTALGNLASVAINTTLLPAANDGAGLGSGTYSFSDLFLASGGVINWNNGNMLITHSAGQLVITGGNVGIGTTNPLAKLQIMGGTNSGLNEALIVSGGSRGLESGPAISFQHRYGNDSSPTWRVGQIGAVYGPGTDWNGALVFLTNTGASETALSEKMRILATGNVGIGTTTPLTPLHVGNGTINNSVDSQILISRNVIDSPPGNGHAFSDSSQIDRTGKISYNSFDAEANILAGESYGHLAGFQFASTFAGTAIDNIYAFAVAGAVSAGTATNYYGYYTQDPFGVGTVTNNYGVYISSLTRGGTLNYAIYTAASTPSYFGGAVSFAGNISPAVSDDVALGSSSVMWSDLFLASGGVINWNNGNMTLTHSAGQLAIATGDLAVNATQLFVDQSAAGVGFGTSTPYSSVTIQKASVPTAYTVGDMYLHVGGTGEANNGTFLIGFGYAPGVSFYAPAYIGFIETTFAGYEKGVLVFGTRDVTTNTQPTEQMRIGTDGAITMASLAGTGSRAVNASATGILSAASDARMKTNFKDLTDEIDVMKLLKDDTIKATFFNWKDTEKMGKQRELGMNYQMWKDIIPEIAGTEGADQHGYFDYQKLTVILWEQNKQLLKRIEELEKK